VCAISHYDGHWQSAAVVSDPTPRLGCGQFAQQSHAISIMNKLSQVKFFIDFVRDECSLQKFPNGLTRYKGELTPRTLNAEHASRGRTIPFV
jgi:hypothetical protein